MPTRWRYTIHAILWSHLQAGTHRKTRRHCKDRSLDPLIRSKSRSLSPTEIKVKIPPPPSPAEDIEDFVSPHSDSKDEEKCPFGCTFIIIRA